MYIYTHIHIHIWTFSSTQISSIFSTFKSDMICLRIYVKFDVNDVELRATRRTRGSAGFFFFIAADFYNVQLDKRVKLRSREIYRLSGFFFLRARAFAAPALTFRFHFIVVRPKMSMTRQTVDDECTFFFKRFTSRCIVSLPFPSPFVLSCIVATRLSVRNAKQVMLLRHEFRNSVAKRLSMVKLFPSYYIDGCDTITIVNFKFRSNSRLSNTSRTGRFVNGKIKGHHRLAGKISLFRRCLSFRAVKIKVS